MSNPAPDSRPRPRYGEYATPEEQRARIQLPDPVSAPSGPSAEPAAAPDTAPPTRAPLRPGRLVDRVLTWALLGYGLVSVVSSVPALVDYGSYAETFLGVLGVQAQLADPAAGQPWGTAAALVLSLGWLAVAVLSWANLRARRISFWIPLVGGFVFNLASGMLMLVPIMSDPAVWSALTSSLQ